MLSPIRAIEVDVDTCDAHVIPDKLKMSDATVPSEKEFDNSFGALNDSRLVKYVRNLVGEQKDVAVEFYDETSMVMLHRSSINTKSTIEISPEGVRKGKVILGHL